jgi:hypothetical protein
MEIVRKMYRLPKHAVEYVEARAVEWGGPDGPLDISEAAQRIIDEHSIIPELHADQIEKCVRLSDENKRLVAICEANNIIIRENWC